jgi:hypothetical protein
VRFDIADIVENQHEQLSVVEMPVASEAHFTEIRLLDVRQRILGPRTIGKVRSHLGSIYRKFLRQAILRLRYNNSDIVVPEPEILEAPLFNDPASPPLRWFKEIDFDFGQGQTVRGFAALRKTMSASEAGFALFRRNRLVQGSADEPYRPHAIFGDSTRFRFQRLFGELEIEGFDVTHTKDGFRWGEAEDTFLELLLEHLRSAPLNLITQAENFRARGSPSDPNASSALDVASSALTSMHVSEALDRIGYVLETGDELAHDPLPEPKLAEASFRDFSFRADDRLWRVRLLLDSRVSPGDLYVLTARDAADTAPGLPALDAVIRVHLNHPFILRSIGPASEGLALLLEFLAALSVAELIARSKGIRFAGAIRRAVNGLLSRIPTNDNFIEAKEA